MLSFLEKFHILKVLFSFIRQSIIAKSLQVPCNPLFFWHCPMIKPKKRVLPFTLRKKQPASMTVEAALAVPLFTFLILALLSPLGWLDTQRKIQTMTERFCEDLSLYGYAESWLDRNETGEGTVSGRREDSLPEAGLAVFSDAAAGLWLAGKAGTLADHVMIRKSHIPDEEGNICLELRYKEKIPFFANVCREVSMNASAKRRCWTGIYGKLEWYGAENEGEEDEEMVYVGAKMSRYHRYRDCHYISNDYRCVSLAEVSEMSNSYGNRFRACSICMKEDTEVSQVYITDEGKHYHSSKMCSSMNAYVRAVPLSEVEALGECSYCARRRAREQ